MQEPLYLVELKQPLHDVAVLMLDTGLRIGEVLKLEWPDVQLTPAKDAKHGYLTIRALNAKNSKSRNIPLTDRASAILKQQTPAETGFVFHRSDGSVLYRTWLNQQHTAVRIGRIEAAPRLRAAFTPPYFRYASRGSRC